jgi:hypothetical protein
MALSYPIGQFANAAALASYLAPKYGVAYAYALNVANSAIDTLADAMIICALQSNADAYSFLVGGVPSSGGSAIPRTFDRKIASVGISGKMAVSTLNTPGITPSNVDCTATGVTFHQVIAAPGNFDAVRVLIPNLCATPLNGLVVGISSPTASQGFQGTLPGPGGNIGQATGGNPNNVLVGPASNFVANSGSGFGKFYFGDHTANVVNLPAAVDASHPSYTATDWTPYTPAARTDGGTLPLVAIRLQYPPNGPGVTLTAGQFANWGVDGALEATRPFNGGRIFKCFADPSQGVDNGINFQGSNNPQTLSKFVPIILQFRMGVDVFTVVYMNDSIAEFNVGGEYANSYAYRGAVAAAAAAGKPLAWCPLTWPSGSIIEYGRLGSELLDLIKPAIVWAKPIGPNETAISPLTQNHQDAFKRNLGFMTALGYKYGSQIIIEPHLAVNNGAPYTWGASDSFRIAGNAYLQSQALIRNYTYINLDTPWTLGGAVVAGQQQPLADNTSDGVHCTYYPYKLKDCLCRYLKSTINLCLQC